MSIRTIPLFDKVGRGTGFLEAQWAKRSPRQPFMPNAALVDREGRPTVYLLKLWPAAFPTKRPLPPVVSEGGLGSDGFWDVFG